MSRIEDGKIYETREEQERRIDRENRRFHYGKKRSRNQAKNISVRRELARRAGNRCEICGFAFSNVLVVHHIMPVSLGGSAETRNLTLICPNCHALVHNYNHYPDKLTVERKYPAWKRGLATAGLSGEQADALLLIASKRAIILPVGHIIPFRERQPLTPVIVDENGVPLEPPTDPAVIEAALQRIEKVFGTSLHPDYAGD